MSGRIRTIKPELLEDERTSALTHEAWRAFVSLILVADDYGNFRAHPKQLEGVIFWAREVVGGISRAIRELVESGLLEVYEVNGQQYGHITGWSKHQRVDKPGKPRCPRPEHGKNVALEEDSRLSRESVESESRTTTESFLPDLRPPTSDPDQDRPPVEGRVTDSALARALVETYEVSVREATGEVFAVDAFLALKQAAPLARMARQALGGDPSVAQAQAWVAERAKRFVAAKRLGNQTRQVRDLVDWINAGARAAPEPLASTRPVAPDPPKYPMLKAQPRLP